jgi:streptogramin lyase
MMKPAFVLAVLALAGASVGSTDGQKGTVPVNYLPNPYETVRHWGQLPDGRSWGSTSAVHVDRDGRHIWVAERCGANTCAGSTVAPILKFDPSGRVVTAFGAGMFIWPHGIHVDRDGNVWVTDARAATAEELQEFPDAKGKGHRIVKFSPQGQVLMTLGEAGEAGDPPSRLTEPNAVITAPNGDLFVAEGHIGQYPEATADSVARVAKFTRDGTFIKSWGRIGTAPGEFKTPHALAIDSQGRLLVADRGNDRIQIFDQAGTFIEEWKQFSRVSGFHILADDTLYAIDSESDPKRNAGWRKGIRIGSARTGEVKYFIPGHMTDTPEGAAGEGTTVDAEGNVYAAEVTVKGLTKYIPRLLPR